jgi:hypothetical protein
MTNILFVDEAIVTKTARDHGLTPGEEGWTPGLDWVARREAAHVGREINGSVGRAGGQQDAVTSSGELAAHLEADAAIASGNQRDRVHIVDCLHIM